MFAYGSGSSITISGTKITATGQYAHGIMASGGGSITATNLDVSTAGASSAAVATDRGGGTIKVVGGTYKTSGVNSPGLYSTGTLAATGATFDAAGAEAAVVEGSNSITVTNSSLTGTKNRGVMIYQSFSGDAAGTNGTFTETGGSLTALAGPLFFVTNTTGTVNLSGVTLVGFRRAPCSTPPPRAGGPRAPTAGTSRSTPPQQSPDRRRRGRRDQHRRTNLSNGSTLTGAINTAKTAKSVTLSLDKTSTWTVTGDLLPDRTERRVRISGTEVTNIVGNGHTVYYDASANPSLGGKTYTLSGGGTLKPA